jgi:hypothetical protein
MKSLFCAIVMVLLALGTPWLAWREYAEVAWFHERGSEGTLSELKETGNTLKRSGRRKRSYDASIDGTRVRIVTSEALAEGQGYPVLFAPEQLRNHGSDPASVFHAFKFGRKADSPWAVFVRDYGKGYLVELAALEILWIAGAWFFWRSSLKREKA